MELNKSDLALCDIDMKKIVEPGEYEIYVSGFSEILPLKGVVCL